MALGKIKADTLEHSTSGSVDTKFVVEGSAKVWCNQSNGTTINDSFNTSSVDDNGTGAYETNLTSSMSSNDYARNALGGTGGYRATIDTVSHTSNTASSIYTYCARADTGAAIDVEDVSSLGHGDLA